MQNYTIYILLALFVALGLVEIFIIFRRRRKALPARDLRLVISEWRQLEQKVYREPKNALMEADKVLDFVLKKKGYTGQLGDKLKAAQGVFSNIDHVWEAHKLRNRAVHEMGFNLGVEEAKRALGYFKKALWDLGIRL